MIAKALGKYNKYMEGAQSLASEILGLSNISPGTIRVILGKLFNFINL